MNLDWKVSNPAKPTAAEILSHLIIGPRANPETEAAIQKQQRTDQEPGFCVFKTYVGHKWVYCCWAGGKLERNGDKCSPLVTLIGQGATEALENLPGQGSALIFAEVRLGKTPLQDKVKQVILDAPDGARICFIGDLAGELDGKMSLAFNITGHPIMLEDLKP